MPTPPNGRPPGRRDGTRPRGHTVPRNRRQAAAATAFPRTEKAITSLQTGDPKLAGAVQDVLDYARFAYAADHDPDKGTLAVQWPTDHLDWFREQTATGVITMSAVVAEYFRRYIDGTWVPEVPGRARRHSNPVKDSTSFSVNRILTAQVDAKAKDPAQNGGRKYNARQIAHAALLAEFPLPEQ